MRLRPDGSSTVSSKREVWSLVVGGDVCPIERVEKVLLADGPEAVMGAEMVEILRGEGLTLVNLESPVCTAESPIEKTGPNFITSPPVIPVLKAAGVDIVAMANNHIMDQGIDGLASTLKLLGDSDIRFHGAGLTQRQARAPVQLEIRGRRACFVNVAEGEFAQCQEDGPGAARLDPVVTCSEIASARETNDYVVVSVHAGNEYQPFPSPYVRELYHDFVDAGASLVLGHHPHIPQGIERYGQGLIFYSLGNFLFDYAGHTGKPCTRIGFLVRVGFDDSGVCAFRTVPFRKREDAMVRLLRQDRVAAFAEYLNAVSEPFRSADEVRRLWEQEVRRLFPSTYLPLFERFCSAFSAGSDVNEDTARVFYNLFRCEAHNGALKTAFRLMHEGRFEEDAEAHARIGDALRLLERLVEAEGPGSHSAPA